MKATKKGMRGDAESVRGSEGDNGKGNERSDKKRK